MYVYHEYFGAKKVALVYPGEEMEIKGNYYHHDNSGINSEKECSIIPIAVENNVKLWQKNIGDRLERW